MPFKTIEDLEIAYELVGDAGAPAIALTPGGRFSKQVPGLPELATALAAGGHRVLSWDRPNCGESQVDFTAENESTLHARILTGLIRELDLGPTALAAGSAGSRCSLIAAAMDPETISHLALWWISGGNIALITLATHYCTMMALTASRRGMSGVADLPAWREQLALRPSNRELILAQDPQEFIATMDRWATFFLPGPDSPVPGMTVDDFAQLSMPTLIFRSSESDLSHPRATTDWVHRLIPHSVMIDPPWPDDEWNSRVGTGREFVSWPQLAPSILEFVARTGPTKTQTSLERS